jgi:hypothetical protein
LKSFQGALVNFISLILIFIKKYNLNDERKLIFSCIWRSASTKNSNKSIIYQILRLILRWTKSTFTLTSNLMDSKLDV